MTRVLVACLALALGSAARAEAKPEPLTGKVSLDGKLLVAGTVTFVAKDGTAATVPLAADGTYSVVLDPGAYRVAIKGPEPKKVDAPPKTGEVPPVLVPAKYGDPATSGLVIVVKGGQQVHDIELKSK